MTDALQKVTREIKAMSADKYDITAQGETEKLTKEGFNKNTILISNILRHNLYSLETFLLSNSVFLRD